MKNLAHILGCHRSGTTWLWSLLEEHPNIEVLIAPGGQAEDGTYKTSESAIYVHPEIKDPKELVSNRCNSTSNIIVEKTPVHTLHFDKINNMFPDCKNILIVRSPLSLYDSYEKSGIRSLPKNKEGIINDIKKYFKQYPKIEKNSLVITYEDLNLNPKAILEQIYDYLELPYIEYDNFNTQTKVSANHVFRKGKSQHPEHLDVFAGEFAEEIKYWKSHLNKEL